MSHVILTTSSVLVVVLVLLLCREVRLRQALQSLLKQLLSFWRSRDEKPAARSGDADDESATGDGLH